MSLPKKKSRPITIDNENYRWIVSPRAKGIVAFIAEKENSNGSIIDVRVESDINNFWTEFPYVKNLNLKVIKPSDAELIIKQAISLGWKPDESGRPNKFDFDGKKLKIASR